MAGAGAGCRCCLNNAVLKDIATEYYWMGDREVYAEMLHECFNIKLSQLGTHRGICDACIFRLRDAICFKRQVLSSEEQTLRHLVKQAIPKIKNEDTVVFKVERPDTSDSEDNIEDNVDDAHMDIEILDEVKGELNMDPKTDEMRKINVELSPKPTAQQPRALKRIHKRPAKVVERNATEQPGPSTSKKSRATSFAKTGLSEEVKFKLNTAAILKYSNATPFKVNFYNRLGCFFCPLSYCDAQQLKEHTAKEHQEDRGNIFSQLVRCDSHIKVDITDLQCTSCNKLFPNLTSFKQHLTQTHKEKIHEEQHDRIIVFELNTDVWYCVVCNEEFESFKPLNQHMNVHYSNFQCEECGASFATKPRLRVHKKSHSDGNYHCDTCNKSYSSLLKLKNHTKYVHNRKSYSKRYQCAHCGEKFNCYYMRKQHIAEHHEGGESIQYKCDECDNVYYKKNKLNMHIRNHHLQQRDYACEICDLRFFTSSGLKSHVVVHMGERPFQCDVCKKNFARKKNLAEHIKTHNKLK